MFKSDDLKKKVMEHSTIIEDDQQLYDWGIERLDQYYLNGENPAHQHQNHSNHNHNNSNHSDYPYNNVSNYEAYNNANNHLQPIHPHTHHRGLLHNHEHLQKHCNSVNTPPSSPKEGELRRSFSNHYFSSSNNNNNCNTLQNKRPFLPPQVVDMDINESLKVERKRARNRVAASKCRLRKLERISVLDQQASQLRADNDELSNLSTKLKSEIYALKEELNWHINNGCKIWYSEQGYMDQKSSQSSGSASSSPLSHYSTNHIKQEEAVAFSPEKESKKREEKKKKRIWSGDAKKKLDLGSDIINYLEDPENSIECEDIGGFIDSVTSWMTSSNFKVSQNGLDIITHLVERLGQGFRLYINTLIGPATDRLGDSRESVREKSALLFVKLMEETVEPQILLEKLTGAYTHKNGKVREEILNLLISTLNSHSSQSLKISHFLPSIISLLGDPTATVRDAAVATLVEIYRHIGERVRVDLERKHNIAPAKMAILTSKFDAVRASGEMMPTAVFTLGTTADGSRGDDETDRQSIKSLGSSKSRSSSVPAIRRGFSMPKPVTADGGRSNAASGIRRAPSIRYASAHSGGQAGAVDEESFMTAFDDVKKVTIYSGRQLNEELTKIRETLTKTSNDWKVRIEALQKMRAFILAGAGSYEELTTALKSLELPFQASVKDLRSQVVREACITIAYMTQQLNHKVDRFIEALLQYIINLISNSAKVMSTSGIVCVRFIIQYTYSSRFIPIITSSIEGKSREIRKQCCITDPDSEARSMARKAYWGFADHFKEQADILLNSLDSTYRRLLQVGDMSNSSSSNSLNTAGRSSITTVTLPRSRQSSITSSQENLLERKMSTLTRKTSGIPLYIPPLKADIGTLSNGSPRQTPPARSNSAIDPSAARRAHVRSQYAQRNRMGIPSGASLPRPRKTSDKGITPESASRNGRGRPKTGGSVLTPIRRRSGIPRSTGPSREASPNRFGSSPSPAKFRSGKAAISLAASVERPPKRPLMTEKILRQSRDAESALANALKNYPRKRSTGGGTLTFDDGSDESETSSLCSDRSFDYGRRQNDDIGEIIANCGSTHWADRKDGLIGLQAYFRDGRTLAAKELRRVTEIFTKMFMDAHTKVFSLFLETLMELVVSHKDDLEDWLYVLLTRLLLKLGADLLGSILQKIYRTLDVVRDSFPYKSQFNVIIRFMVDQTQTPNIKVKVGTLNYLLGIAQLMDPSDIKYSNELDVGLAKIIAWTYEPKSPEENASELVQKYLSNTTTPMKPRYSPNSENCSSNIGSSSKNRELIDPIDDSENLNPEDVIKSLRSTANAIQNYSFDSKDIRDTGEMDFATAGLEDSLSRLDLSIDLPHTNEPGDNLKSNMDGMSRDEEANLAMKDIILELQSVKTRTRSAERRASMSQLIRIAREGNNDILLENFRTVLRLLLENLSDDVGSTRALAFGVLTEMLKKEQLIPSFQAFTELIILKVLEAHKDEEKDVERAAESCAASMALVISPDMVIRVLNPIIKTGEFPVNRAAIKMLTKVNEHENNKEALSQHLGELMPGLLKAYDNQQSSVRKAAVFCMVALHQLIGDGLQPYLDGLNGSKLKLLNLYIKRAQTQTAPVNSMISTP
ncbi:CLASP1_2 [Lepeophtheirus salmonis]|uniref:CLASP1_2 n=1 Tax=Lepeophtheirus salmonis TaxID=72036 RepID=A0A7R8H9F6_LEPSM|nr:CLASP1_2 [Lepeophtheirus salmonis]CAF2957831.1 CLASP1_2 [Lepeophtheirus salmonis]